MRHNLVCIIRPSHVLLTKQNTLIHFLYKCLYFNKLSDRNIMRGLGSTTYIHPLSYHPSYITRHSCTAIACLTINHHTISLIATKSSHQWRGGGTDHLHSTALRRRYGTPVGSVPQHMRTRTVFHGSALFLVCPRQSTGYRSLFRLHPNLIVGGYFLAHK